MAKRPTNEMILCDVCGLEYSATYKRCPFCEEEEAERLRREEGEEIDFAAVFDMPDDEYEEDDFTPSRKGGRRLTRETRRGGGYTNGGGFWRTLGWILSALIIVAAILILIRLFRGRTPSGGDDPEPSASQTVSPSPSGSEDPFVTDDPSAEPTGEPTDEPTAEPTGEPTDDPAPSTDPGVPANLTFTLQRTEFTISVAYPSPYRLLPTFYPVGSTATLTWTSSNPAAVTVDSTGLVSPVAPGNAYITATAPNGYSQTCYVVNYVTGSTAPTGGGSTPTQSTTPASLKLNRTDFTLFSAGETFKMEVSGTSSTPKWSIGNPAVATIDSTGLVRAVGSGYTFITCTVDGQELTCKVICNFNH